MHSHVQGSYLFMKYRMELKSYVPTCASFDSFRERVIMNEGLFVFRRNNPHWDKAFSFTRICRSHITTHQSR